MSRGPLPCMVGGLATLCWHSRGVCFKLSCPMCNHVCTFVFVKKKNDLWFNVLSVLYPRSAGGTMYTSAALL